uniref:Secreted protein n=1 Tax=Romanomermis culicivorax TaxID=13658 RepID=A0A915IH31_ROMCU
MPAWRRILVQMSWLTALGCRFDKGMIRGQLEHQEILCVFIPRHILDHIPWRIVGKATKCAHLDMIRCVLSKFIFQANEET